jgi:prepilin-type processing-associated H-X9-DG protein
VSWHTRLLPYLEQEELAKQAADAHALGQSPQSWPAHHAVARQSVKAFLCPTEHRLRNADGMIALASYRGVAGINVRLLDGMFHPNFVVRLTDVPDGLSSTLLIGERPSGPGGLFGGWYSGHDYSICTWAQLQPAGYTAREAKIHPCPNKASPSFQPGTITDPCAADWFWSEHPRGANFAFADGSVRFLTYGSAAMLPLLATRQGGETIPPGDE